MEAKNVYGICGLDRLGKSTLIEGIRQKLGYYEIIHFSKPQKLAAYEFANSNCDIPRESQQMYEYQSASFHNSMMLANSGARIIFDRWHLGETVYSPMYRGFCGDYVFDIERYHNLDKHPSLRYILLVEDFATAKHFVDDGESLGSIENRQEEQNRFIAAFEKSIIRDKRIVCVTDKAIGGFKPMGWILDEVLL
ncbi:MAG: hypothetical protein DDT31_00198 [Syntrophomonadaceae bacterium]|nr:hypothetical protein [Bacillota bacterium]